MAKTFSFLFLFSLVLTFSASAQYYLQLKKRTKVIHTYSAGDHIKFKLKGDDFYSDQVVIGVTDSTIKFRLLDIALTDIEAVKVPERGSYGLDLISGAAITAGIFFMVIDQANQLFVQGEGLGPSKETLLISGSLIGSGLFLRLFKKKKFKFKSKRYRLVATDFNFEGA